MVYWDPGQLPLDLSPLSGGWREKEGLLRSGGALSMVLGGHWSLCHQQSH